MTAGRYLRVEGLLEGSPLNSASQITVSATAPESVIDVVARVGGIALTVDGDGPWTVPLDPIDVGPGSHALTVEIRYADGETIIEVINFRGPPSWEADIEPLVLAHCANCHGVQGAPLPLETAAQWTTLFDEILVAVETGRMPIGSRALNVDELDLIRNWATGGFFDAVGD